MLTKGGKLQTVLDRFRKQVIDGSKKQLKTQKKNVGGKLSNSLKSELKVFPNSCLLYTSPSPRDQRGSRMPSSA